MTWETFYDRFDSWSVATLRRHLAELTDYGPADQVIEVADYLDDANGFIKAALQHDVVFNAADLLELDGLVTQATLEEAVRHSLANGIIFTHDELLEFDGLMSAATLTEMVKASHLSSEELLDFDGLVDESILPHPTPDEPPQQPFSLFGKRTKGDLFQPRKRRESPDDFYVAYALHDMTMEEDRRRKATTFQVGDIVHAGGVEGIIIDKNGPTYTVRCGRERYYFKASEMSK